MNNNQQPFNMQGQNHDENLPEYDQYYSEEPYFEPNSPNQVPDRQFPGQGIGVGGQFPGQGVGVGGQFPGQIPGQFPGGGIPPSMMPSTPPPAFIPEQPPFQVFAVDPGAIRGCLFRFTFIWLRRDSFWFFPVFVGRRSVAGFRWIGFRWVFFGIDLDRIEAFQCF